MSDEMAKFALTNKKDNVLLAEKIKKFKAVWAALIKDKDTVTIVSEDSDGNSPEFAAKIIEAVVNNKASDKYESDVEENTDGTIEPYCASYPVY